MPATGPEQAPTTETPPAPHGPAAPPLGLYVHIPFCAHKCPYCDFNTYAGLDDQFQAYGDALCKELADWGQRLEGRLVETIFIGGGTPTVLPAPLLEQIVTAIHAHFHLATTCEISCEANPGTVDQAKFITLRRLGVNRLSMGVQSFQPAELAFLGRIHDAQDPLRAFAAARSAGFDNINLDFIFGLPHQSVEAWSSTLAQAVAMAPEHLSLYSLIVEPHTPLHQWVQSGQVAAPDEDASGALYELALDRLAAAGYTHYEISNWACHQPATAAAAASAAATPSRASRHNLLYWRNQEYLGVGPGAHSHLRVADAEGNQAERRWANRKPVAGYIRRMARGESVEAYHEQVPPRLAMAETMMLGLRLVQEGVPFHRFQDHHGVEMEAVFATELTQLRQWRLIEVTAQRVRLTPRGLMIGNQVFTHFMPDSAAD